MIHGGTPDDKPVRRRHGNRPFKHRQECNGKAPMSLHVAQEVMAKRLNRCGRLDIYRCQACGAYHLGRRG